MKVERALDLPPPVCVCVWYLALQLGRLFSVLSLQGLCQLLVQRRRSLFLCSFSVFNLCVKPSLVCPSVRPVSTHCSPALYLALQAS